MNYGFCDYCTVWTYSDLTDGACPRCIEMWRTYPDTVPASMRHVLDGWGRDVFRGSLDDCADKLRDAGLSYLAAYSVLGKAREDAAYSNPDYRIGRLGDGNYILQFASRSTP
jgi:hypothetical protein